MYKIAQLPTKPAEQRRPVLLLPAPRQVYVSINLRKVWGGADNWKIYRCWQRKRQHRRRWRVASSAEENKKVYKPVYDDEKRMDKRRKVWNQRAKIGNYSADQNKVQNEIKI